MIDGIKISHLLSDARAWKQATNLDFAFYVNEDTGEKIAKKPQSNTPFTTYLSKSRFETFELVIRETHKQDRQGKPIVLNWLNIEGSLHKNHYQGANHNPFNWLSLQREIEHLRHDLCLENESKIDNLEIGINIPMPFPVFPFLQKNLIAYKGRSFKEYEPDKKGVVLGYYCPFSQYEVKVYDKALQFNLPSPLMRVELRFTKMEIPNRMGIFHLTDLQDHQKVNSCLPLLINAWQEVLLYDDTIEVDNPKFTTFQRDLLLKGTNRSYWEISKKDNIRLFNDRRGKFRTLVQEHGKNYHLVIREKIKSEWEDLMQSAIIIPSYPENRMYKLTIKVKCQNVHPKTCLTCGKDISHQHKSSKYCSEERLGKQGKQCRNKGSNSRNNLKRKIAVINNKGVLFDIIPYLKKKPA